MPRPTQPRAPAVARPGPATACRRRQFARGIPILAATAGIFLTTGCRQAIPPGAIVVTQTPLEIAQSALLLEAHDLHYPAGSRIVLVRPGSGTPQLRVLSTGFHSAGEPVMTWDGQQVLFAGKETPQAPWQIYQVPLAGGKPAPLTRMKGGAVSPTVLPDGRFVFVSPSPKAGLAFTNGPAPALYAQSFAGGLPQQLTFGLAGVFDPTVLDDGRILFVSGGSRHAALTNFGLFTVNNDGTEFAAFACQHDGEARLHRPRSLDNGRLVFLSRPLQSIDSPLNVEQVLLARPFSSRTRAFTLPDVEVRAVQPGAGNELLIAARQSSPTASGPASFGLWRLAESADHLEAPILDDSQWNEVEAVAAMPRRRPMGRLSTMNTNRTTGLILCLDANFTSYDEGSSAATPARRVRFLAGHDDGSVTRLGEVPLQKDGSFLVEVPANVPIGFEALDASGQVVRRFAPSVWVRPGENRACIGCHEPHGYCPENRRPLAVKQPPRPLGDAGRALALSHSEP